MGRKRSRRWLIAAAAAGVPAASLLRAPKLAAQEPPRFRVNVRLVRMLATVKDMNGQLVGGLSRDDFVIYDSGVRQEIALFSYTTETPLSVALLIDTSGSTAIRLHEETDSTVRFLNALFGEGNPRDRVALYSFSHDVTLEERFTRDAPAIERSLRQLKGEAGTSLYDAVYFAARALESRDGRRVILIVTDGADTTSVRNFHAAVRAAHDADAAIYGIMIVPVTSDAGRHIAGENALISLSTGTGGRVFGATLGDTLDLAFTDILRDLRSQYLLGYYPRNVPYSREPFHRIEVKATGPGLRVSTRTGYYGEYGEATQSGP